jgi:hypothetical protein
MEQCGDAKINCVNLNECPCPKRSCPNNGNCCLCVIKHKNTDSLPFCLFLDNGGDKSVANYYKKLKERFEGTQ